MLRAALTLMVVLGALSTRPADAQETPGSDDGQDRQPSEEVDKARASPANTRDDEISFDIQLRSLRERVGELKQRAYQSKARLTQLKEVVMLGAIFGARVRLVHKNEMGSSFRLSRAQYTLDGAPIVSRVDDGDGSLDDLEELEIFNGGISPGEHQMSVSLEYIGHGYGIFSYLRNYQFKVKSSFSFTAEKGKLVTINVVGYEKGNFTTELKDRVAIRYDQSVESAIRSDVIEDTNSDEEAESSASGES